MKKSSRFAGLVLALVGAMVLLNNLGKPRVEALHGSDVCGLVASGMLSGIGFIGLMGRLNFASSRNNQTAGRLRTIKVREGYRAIAQADEADHFPFPFAGVTANREITSFIMRSTELF